MARSLSAISSRSSLCACGLRPPCARRRSLSADASALARRRLVHLLAAAGTAGLLSAASHIVDGGPGTALGFVLADTALLIAFLDVLGLAFLLAGVFRLVATGHGYLLRTGYEQPTSVSQQCSRNEARAQQVACFAPRTP
jgi:hypothetical protein